MKHLILLTGIKEIDDLITRFEEMTYDIRTLQIRLTRYQGELKTLQHQVALLYSALNHLRSRRCTVVSLSEFLKLKREVKQAKYQERLLMESIQSVQGSIKHVTLSMTQLERQLDKLKRRHNNILEFKRRG